MSAGDSAEDRNIIDRIRSCFFGPQDRTSGKDGAYAGRRICNHPQRHAIIFNLKTGVKKDGTITARSCRSVMDGGAYNSLGIVTCYLTAFF